MSISDRRLRNLALGAWLAALVLTAAVLVADQARPQDIRLQAAVRLEAVEGNLQAAVAEYEAIAREYEKTDRHVAALALIHLADCYRKLGEARARPLYEDVARKFVDQPDAVAMARSRLDAWTEEASANRWAWTESGETSLASSVSPDGRQLAVVDWSKSGKGDLFIQPLGARTPPRRVVSSLKDSSGKAVAGADDAVFSRDVRQLAYTWYEKDKTELRVVAIGGATPGKPRTLFANPEVCCVKAYDWSPDGSSIAILLQKRDQSASLALISTEDGGVKYLKSLTWRRPSRMAFSPDGKLLAFDLQGAETNARDIFAFAIDDGREVPLVVYKGNDELAGWAPDGSLLFTSDRMNSVGLWMLPAVAGQLGPAKRVRGDLGRFSAAGVTASGAIYYCRCEPDRGSDILMGTFDFSTGYFTGAVIDAVQEFVGTNSQPFWSPDGKTFLYRSLRENQDPVIAIRSADLKDVRELRPKMRSLIDPRWSPDGRFISVLGRDFEGRYGFHLIDVATAAVKPIALALPGESFFAMDERLAWSRDGTKVFFRRKTATEFQFVEWDLASADERLLLQFKEPVVRNALITSSGSLIWMNPVAPGRVRPSMMRRDGTAAQRELASAATLQGLNPSPDGKWIASTAGDVAGINNKLVIVPTDGGPMRELWTVSGGAVLGQGNDIVALNAWAPDSQSIVVAKVLPNNKGTEYWWLPIDGRPPHRIEDLRGRILSGRIRIHPDGRTVIFGATEAAVESRPMELWVFEDLVSKAIVKR